METKTYSVTIGGGTDFKETIGAMEKQILEDAMASQGSLTGAAEWLGLKRTTLFEKMKRHGMLKPQQHTITKWVHE